MRELERKYDVAQYVQNLDGVESGKNAADVNRIRVETENIT